MRDTFLRMLTDMEKNILHQLMVEDTEAGYRAKIILLLKDDGYTVPEIRRRTTNNRHDSSNIRKWIHHFNEETIMVDYHFQRGRYVYWLEDLLQRR